MSGLFVFLLLISIVCLVLGLIMPAWFNKVFRGSASRKKIAITFISAIIVFFVLIGVTSPKTTISQKQVIDTTSKTTANQQVAQSTPQSTSNSVATTSASSAIIPQPIKTPPASIVKNIPTQITKPNTTTSSNTTTPVTQSSQPATTPTPQPTPAPPAPKSPATSFGDGNYVVSTDIQPGTYRTRVGSPGCYYARLSGFSGSMDEILANNNTDFPAVITIPSSDKGFQSSSCGTWTQDLSEITSSQTSFGDGIFIVGTDMLPGTYRSSGSTGCYYARVSGFSGTDGEILANDNTDTAAVVTILASDKGFVSSNCGTWVKID